MEGTKPKSSGQSIPDGHATGLLGLPAVLDRLSDPSHRCQGPELTCLLQALCKQLISTTSDTSLAIFTSADRSRTTAAQAAAANVVAELSLGAPERCIASPQPFSSEFASSYHARSHTDVGAPASSQNLPTTAASTNTTPLALVPAQPPLNRAAAAARADAAVARRPPAGPSKTTQPLAASTMAAATAASGPPPASSNTAAATISGLSPAAREPTEGLAGMVTAGIALLVDHLEHFHYRAKAVALDGLLTLSAVGLGPDRRLDPAGITSLPLPASAGGSINALPCSATVAAAAAEMAAAAAAANSQTGEDPAAIADAVQALCGLGLGDWLALRIVSAGAVPRLLEMLTQRTGMNFVPVRQLASQVVHNLARRRNAAVRTALARWRPLPGLVSSLDVVLEDSPEIAARLLLVLSDLFPITCHQIAGALHKLIAKQQQDQAAAAQPPLALPPPPQPTQQQKANVQQNEGVSPGQQQQQLQHVAPQQQQQQLVGKPPGEAPAADARGGNAAGQKVRAGLAPEPQLAPAKGRRAAKGGVQPAEPAGAAAGRGAAAGGAGAAAAPAAGRPRRGAAVAPAPAAAARLPVAALPEAAQVAPAPVVAPGPGPLVPAGPAAAAAATADSTGTTHLGLAPDVDVPLEALLMRVAGYYMRLAYTAVLSPAPLPQPTGVRPPYGEAERRECEKVLLTQKVEEHRRRRKEAAQLDCCVAALLATAPMPSCLFEALSYSHARAFAVLAGPPPLSTSLTAAASGGLWRAQDLLPYALNLIQTLGGGSDSGDGGSAAFAFRGLGAAASFSSSSTTAAAAAGLLLPALAGAGPNGGGGAACSLNGSSSAVVSVALDRFWGLERPRRATQGRMGFALYECPGPSLPSAPYGDKPVTAGLLEQCGPVMRVILERAIQAADAVPVAAAAGPAAVAAPSAPAAAAEILAARIEALPLAVLRSIGATFLSINRVQVAQRVLSFDDCLERLTAGLSRRTDGPAAGVAQARMALGLVNLWACVAAAAAGACALRSGGVQQRQESKTLALEAAVLDAGRSSGAAVREVVVAAAVVQSQQQEDDAAADKHQEPPLRRSTRIKRRRDGATSAPGQAQEADRKEVPASAPGSSATTPLATESAAADVAAADARERPSSSHGKLLEALVDMLAVRFADARQLQDSLDLQLRQQQEQQWPEDADAQAAASQAASSALAAPLNAAAAAAASGAAGAWLAAVASAAAAATAAAPADRARLVLETQAFLLQSVALLLPSLDASQASRLVDAGAVHAAARLVRSAATSASVATAPAATPASDAATAAGTSAALPAAAAGADRGVEGSRDGQCPWNEEPVHGVTAAQALGLLVQLLRLSGAGSYGCGGLHQPEALAALGGALLLRRRPVNQCRVPALQLPAAAAAAAQDAERLTDGGADGSLDDPTSQTWELLVLMSSGEQPCAGHNVVLQLLGPLAAMTHGSSARCAAARAALVGVLLQVLKWSHSKTQRRRLLCQVLALWGPHLQALLLQLPRLASPAPAPRAAALLPPLAIASAMDVPLGLAAAAEAKATAAVGPCTNLGRTNSQSTMPYPGSRSGRLSTPIHSVHAPPHAGGTSAAPACPGQRTPPWGGCAAAPPAAASGSVAGSAVHAPAAAPASHAMSPTRHTSSGSGLRTAVPPAPNALRGRRGSRLAAGLASPLPLAASRSAGCLQGDGDAVGVGAVTAAAAVGVVAMPAVVAEDADALRNSVTLTSLCELLEAVMERLVDCEVVRHLHATGWLRALCHGAHCPETTVRESCHRAMTSAARALGSGGRSLPPLLLADLEADTELRNHLCSLEPGVAVVLTRRQETSALPPRGPDGVQPRSAAAAVGGRPSRAGGLPAATTAAGQRLSDASGGAPPPSSSSWLALQRSSGAAEALPAAAAASGGGDDECGGVELGGGLQLPEELELVLPPPPPGEQQLARRGRRRGAAAAAARAPSRARKGSRPTGAAVRGTAAAVAAATEPELPKAGEEAEGSEGQKPTASRRTRARKGAATRRVRGATTQQQQQDEAVAPPEGLVSAADACGNEGAAAAAPALGPGPLVSPLPKRRRVSELNGDEGDDEHQGSVAGVGAVAAAGALPAAQVDDGANAGGKTRPPLRRAALFPSAVDTSPVLSAVSETVLGNVAAAATVTAGASGAWPAAAVGATGGGAAAVSCTAEPPGGAAVVDREAALELQLTARELHLAAAVRSACVSLESALAARRHDLAAVRAADQAAAAAAAAAATMAVAAAAAAPEPAAAAAEDAATAQAIKKKVGRGRATASGSGPVRGATSGKHAAAAAALVQQAAAAAPPAAAAVVVVAAAAAQPTQPVAVADEEFLSRTYRGVSKKLNFDDM